MRKVQLCKLSCCLSKNQKLSSVVLKNKVRYVLLHGQTAKALAFALLCTSIVLLDQDISAASINLCFILDI